MRGRPRLRLFLSDAELAELDRVVAETGALTRSLVVAEAIHAGLVNPNLSFTQEKKPRIIDVRLPKEVIEDVRRLAKLHTLTRQSLLRQLLTHYLAHLPWKTNESGQNETDVEEDAAP